ncbi:hypothetical protein [Pandoraea sp. PE-S2R-1]|uniref:hypothetical protein n=1 Tax=Pandoraea sp. PE-S2R-1 TaxID=1986994 RepID=UPI000B3FA499|nr:hypothetical protein [Pandoraea sp. PE-S2R-1]
MANPIPLSKARAAFAELGDIAHARIEADEFTLARCERDAKASFDEDPIGALQLLGVVASFRWDDVGVQSNFERALAMGGSTTVQSNYARALGDINRYRQAANQFLLASGREPENLALLRSAIVLNFSVFEFDVARELCEKLAQRTPSLGDDMREDMKMIEGIEKLGVDLETVRRTIDCALSFLASKNVRAVGFKQALDVSDGDGCLYVDVVVRTSEVRARELDEEFTPVLFDSIEHPQLSSIVVGLEAAAQ